MQLKHLINFPDQDECALEMCHWGAEADSFSACHNTPGSYDCDCKPGFRLHVDSKKHKYCEGELFGRFILTKLYNKSL